MGLLALESLVRLVQLITFAVVTILSGGSGGAFGTASTMAPSGIVDASEGGIAFSSADDDSVEQQSCGPLDGSGMAMDGDADALGDLSASDLLHRRTSSTPTTTTTTNGASSHASQQQQRISGTVNDADQYNAIDKPFKPSLVVIGDNNNKQSSASASTTSDRKQKHRRGTSGGGGDASCDVVAASSTSPTTTTSTSPQANSNWPILLARQEAETKRLKADLLMARALEQEHRSVAQRLQVIERKIYTGPLIIRVQLEITSIKA